MKTEEKISHWKKIGAFTLGCAFTSFLFLANHMIQENGVILTLIYALVALGLVLVAYIRVDKLEWPDDEFLDDNYVSEPWFDDDDSEDSDIKF